MADSDDEYDRKRRDKFRGERAEAPYRGAERVARPREEWSERDSWSRPRPRDYRSGVRDRGYSPSMEPAPKRIRHDYYGDSYFNHYTPYHQTAAHRPGNFFRESQSTSQAEGQQPPMMSFKAFLATQDDNISDSEAIEKYNDYKLEFQRQQLNEFFVAHKDDEWFRLKYHPEDSVRRKDEQMSALKRRVEVFLDLLNGGKLKNVSVDVAKTSDLLKLLDTVVIKLEGGTDEDIELLEQEYTELEEKSKDQKTKEDTTTTASNAEKAKETPEAKKEDGEVENKKGAEHKSNGDGNESKDEDGEIPNDSADNADEAKQDNAKVKNTPTEKEPLEEPMEKDKVETENETKEEDDEEEDEEQQAPEKEKTLVEEEEEQEEKKLEDKKPKRKRSFSGSEASGSSNSSSESEDEEKKKKKEKKKEKKAAEKAEPEATAAAPTTEPVEEIEDEKIETIEDDKPEKPKALHKTTSIFLRNLAPTITKQEVEAMCARYGGFLRVALADPQPERRWLRRGWVTFKRDANIKEICWNLNNIRLRECELGAIVNRDLSRRIRPINGITAHKQVVRSDIRISARVVLHLDTKAGLWPEEEKDKEVKQPTFGLVSNNPVLHNITDYLIEEASAEEEELLGLEPSSETQDAMETVERDDCLVEVLDRIILYLRVVHSVDYYNHCEYPNEDEMPNRCGILHARGPPPTTKTDMTQFIGNPIEVKMASFLPEKPRDENNKNEVKLISLSLKDVDTEIDKFVQANTRELAKDKWLCPLSGKKFKGPDFVRKHIFNKHGEKIEEVKKEVEFFNNYLKDAKRPMLAEAPQPKREEPPAYSHSGYGGGAFGGGQGGGGYGRQPYYNQGFQQRSRGYAPRSRGGSGGEFRPVIHYRDLDAPRESEEFI